MYRVFTDFHHQSLLNSLIMLFEGRLGGQVYRPIGMEWYEQGYWNVYPQIETAKQFLEINNIPLDGTPSLNSFEDDLSRAITLEQFKQQQFDYLIASIPQHIAPFRQLLQQYQPQAKLIYQVGNAWNIDNFQGLMLDGVMASARVNVNETILGFNNKPLPRVTYHQEFPTNIFYPVVKKNTKKIYSFINVLQEKPKDWELFLALEKLMPDWEFKAYGGQCRDGNLTGSEALADKMREATFAFHCKTDGDGYGHIIHNLACTGTPIITRLADYQAKLAEPLIRDITAITVDNKTPEEIVDQINQLVPNIEIMGDAMRLEFFRQVDFDQEEKAIRRFLEELQ